MRPRRKITTGITAVAVAALLFAAGRYAFAEDPSSVDATSAADPVIRVDYEDGTKNSGHPKLFFNECCTSSITVTDLARTGDHAIRSHLAYGDAMVAGGTRAESHTVKMDSSYFDAGDTSFYGFSIYVMSTWKTDSREDIVFQWHNWPDECEPSKVPSAFLSIQPNGQWRLRVNSDGTSCSTSDSIKKTSYDLGAIKPGQWNDFVFKFRWDYDADGAIQAWHQGHKAPGWREVLNTTGPNTFKDDPTTHGYLKWGIYKPAWNTAPTDVGARVLVHDNIAVGTTFAAVDPSAG